MAAELHHVKPGDLITASHFNDLTDAVLALQAGTRPGAGPQIDRLDPPDRVTVRGDLRIVGSGFVTPVDRNRVTFGGAPASSFVAGDERELVVTVPPLSGLPRELDVRVENDAGHDTARVLVVAEQRLPVGDVHVVHSTVGGTQVTRGQPVTYTFTIGTEEVGVAESYTLEALIDSADPAASASAWRDSARFIGATGDRVTIDPAEGAKQVGVTLVVPDDANSADLRLRVRSVLNPDGAFGESGPVTMTVGAAQVTGDPSIDIELSHPLSPALREPVAGTIAFPFGRSTPVVVRFNVTTRRPGTYRLRAAIANGGSVWSMPEVDVTEPGTNHELVCPIRLLLAAETAGQPEERTLKVTVVGTPTDQPPGEISNELTIPIQGFTP